MFSDISPFVEIAFGLNLAFGYFEVFSKFINQLLNLKTKLQRRLDPALLSADDRRSMEKHEKNLEIIVRGCFNWHERIQKNICLSARIIAVVPAFACAIILYLGSGNPYLEQVYQWRYVLILPYPGYLALATAVFVLMYIVTRALGIFFYAYYRTFARKKYKFVKPKRREPSVRSKQDT